MEGQTFKKGCFFTGQRVIFNTAPLHDLYSFTIQILVELQSKRLNLVCEPCAVSMSPHVWLP